MPDQRVFDARLLVELGEAREGPCVSIYLPSVGAGVESRQDSVRLRNLVREVEDRLADGGMRRTDARSMLADAGKAADAGGPWTQRASSLGVFVSRDDCRHVRFQTPVRESVLFGRRYIVRPLLPDLAITRDVEILAVSRGSARMLELGPDGLTEMRVPGMPPSLEDATQFEDPERQVQFHSAGGTQGGAMFHGQGARKDGSEELTREYLREISRAVASHRGNRRDSLLVLAAPDEILAEFEDLGLPVDDTIAGAPERMDERDLFARARLAVESDAGKRLLDAIARFNDLAATTRAAHHVREVLPAAYQGRVAELFLATDAEVRGVFDGKSGNYEVSDDRGAETDDLLDLAAHYVLKHGGQVHVVELTDIPGGAESGPVAAILRS